MERSTLQPRKDTNYSNTFNKMIRSFPPSNSLSETHFFMRFRKRIDSFADFECKKMGRTFLCIPLLLAITKEDYFFQVTDLQPFKP